MFVLWPYLSYFNFLGIGKTIKQLVGTLSGKIVEIVMNDIIWSPFHKASTPTTVMISEQSLKLKINKYVRWI